MMCYFIVVVSWMHSASLTRLEVCELWGGYLCVLFHCSNVSVRGMG